MAIRSCDLAKAHALAKMLAVVTAPASDMSADSGSGSGPSPDSGDSADSGDPVGVGYIDPRFKSLPELYHRFILWLIQRVPASSQEVLGTCRKYSEEFASDFRDLGFRVVGRIGFTQHCWCVNQEGWVVDPAAHQYTRPYNYLPVEGCRILELHEFPTGACPNCGELIFGRSDGICSDECHEDYTRYITREANGFLRGRL